MAKIVNFKEIIDMAIIYENKKYKVLLLYEDFTGFCVGIFKTRQEARYTAHEYGFILD